MKMKHHALQQYDYHVWANRKMFNRLNELPKDVYVKEIQSVFPSIAEVLVHMYVADNVWLGVIRGDSFEEISAAAGRSTEEVKGKCIEEIEKAYSELAEKYKTYLEEKENLDESISPEHPKFGRLNTRISELIQHVVNHGTYHRGNITAMLRQLGYAGPPTDYILYLYEQQGNI